MAVAYGTVFGPLGAELQNMRKMEALYEQFHFISNSQYSKRLIEGAYSVSADVYQEVAQNLASNLYEQSLVPQFVGINSAMKGQFERGYFPVLDNQLTTSPADKAAGAILATYDPTLTDGTISILQRNGRWAALQKQMVTDNQLILQNTITFGGLVAVGGNLGVITLSSIIGLDHTLNGTITILCVSDTVQQPQFQVFNVLANKLPDPTLPTDATGQFSIVSADRNCTLGKSFQEQQLGITMQLALGSLVITDPSAFWSVVSVSNATESDTNKGKVYLKVTRQGSSPIWLIQWYKDAAFTQIVTQTTADGTVGTVALPVMTGAGGTQVQATLNLATANTALPLAGNTYTGTVFDIKTPRINDQWTVSVTNNEAGPYATKIAHRYRASLNSAKNAAPTVGAPSAGGSVTVGLHSYVVTFVVNGVETCESLKSAQANVTTGGTQTVPLTAISLGPSGTTARKIYRTVAGDTGNYLLLTTISDNVTTTFNDTVADGSLGAAVNVPIWDNNAVSVSMS